MSAEVAIQKLSFPFSCTTRLSQQDELTQKTCIQVKGLELHPLQDNPILKDRTQVTIIGASFSVQNGIQAQESPRPSAEGVGVVRAEQAKLLSADSAQGGVLSRRSVFERLMVESEDQRPAAKRQLSTESAAKTVAVVKKSAVRKETEEEGNRKPKGPKPGPRGKPCTVIGGVGLKRRRRRDLFSSSEVFHRVDAHAIKAGAEVGSLTRSNVAYSQSQIKIIHRYHCCQIRTSRNSKTVARFWSNMQTMV